MDITPAPRQDLENTKFLEEAKEVLNEVVETKNFDTGFNFIVKLLERGKAFARGISMLLEGMEEAWKPSEHEGESFMQAAMRRTGLSPETIRRHTKIQRLLESDYIPPEFKEQFESAGQKSLEQIANLREMGYEVEHDDWLKISEKADDDKRVRQIIQSDVKGVPPRSNWLLITMDERGVLVARTKDGSQEFGRLDKDSTDPAVQKAVARIVGCAGIQLSVEF